MPNKEKKAKPRSKNKRKQNLLREDRGGGEGLSAKAALASPLASDASQRSCTQLCWSPSEGTAGAAPTTCHVEVTVTASLLDAAVAAESHAGFPDCLGCSISFLAFCNVQLIAYAS